MTTLTDQELKDRLISLFLSKDFEQRAEAQKSSKRTFDDKPPETKLRYNESSRIAQSLINDGLPIHEKQLNKILVQTIKQQLHQDATEKEKSATNKKSFGYSRSISGTAFDTDFLTESKNKRLQAEANIIIQSQGEKEKTSGLHASNRQVNTRLDQGARRLLRNLEYFADTATLSTAVKGRELDILMKNSRTEDYAASVLHKYSKEPEMFRLQNIIPNKFNIVDVDSIKINKLS